MLLNDFKKDYKMLLIKEGRTQESMTEAMGKSTSALSQVFYRQIMSPVFIRLIDLLGYDIEVLYHKRDN